MKHRRKKERQQKMSKEQEEQQREEIPETEEAVQAEEAAGEEAAEAQKETEEANPLKAKLDEAVGKAAEYLGIAQRVQADFENFRRRNETVRADAYAEGKKDVAAMMLPVLDNLERAVEAGAASEDEALRNGMELVLRQMQDAYQKLDVTPINRLGEKFDPNLENAILQGTPEEGEPGTVCQVLQKGYKIGDRVLRHAMVKVVPE